MSKRGAVTKDLDRPYYFFPTARLLCSQPLNTFVEDVHRQVDFIHFSLQLATESDEASYMLSTAILKMPHLIKDNEHRRRLERSAKRPNAAQEHFTASLEDLCRNAFVSSMNSFYRYLSAIIQSAMKKRPDLLKSSETMLH
jgi:hypothetical protein